MGNTIEQYRAAIGLFYMSGRGISKKHPFLVFSSVYILLLLNNIFKILAHCMKCTSHRSVYINFYLQFFTFILLACGDIEVNPGPSTENILDILHLNIRSIRHKLGYLNSFVHDFDILCFTETHLDNTVNNTDLHLDGFSSILRKDRNRFWGGVMIYLSNQIRVTRHQEIESADLECIWIEIDNHAFSCILFSVFMGLRFPTLPFGLNFHGV